MAVALNMKMCWIQLILVHLIRYSCRLPQLNHAFLRTILISRFFFVVFGSWFFILRKCYCLFIVSVVFSQFLVLIRRRIHSYDTKWILLSHLLLSLVCACWLEMSSLEVYLLLCKWSILFLWKLKRFQKAFFAVVS